MRAIRVSTILLALAALPFAALAGGKHEYWDGNCKIKIKEKKGHYEEKRKCKGHEHVHAAPVYVMPQPVVVAPRPVVLAPQPVYVPAPVVMQPGVSIQATIPIR